MSTIIDDGIWNDPWMQSLTTVPKLLYLYLWTNDHRNLACLYEISVKTMVDESGLAEEEIRAGLAILQPKVAYDWERHICWVKSFVKRQFLRYGHISPKIVSGITKNLNGLPQAHPFIYEFLDLYPSLNIAYPYAPLPAKKELKPKREKPVMNNGEAMVLAEYLWGWIKKNRTERNLSNPKPPNLRGWAVEFDLMLRRDQHTPDHIRSVIDWSQQDHFWWKNILSPSKLRDKFGRLEADMVAKPTYKKEPECDDPYKDVPVIGRDGVNRRD